MIGTALGQVQKLFGRGFLIAAFMASLLFVAVARYLWWGFEALKEMVLGWAQKELKEAGFEMLLALVLVYLLAYVLYGVRGALHQLYQGEWPVVPLKWLRSAGLALERRKMRQYEDTLHAKELALDDPAWAIDFGFTETYSAIELTSEEARPRLQKVRDFHQSLLHCLEKGQKLEKEQEEKAYWSVLGEARLLQANRDRFPADLQKEIDQLVAGIKRAYDANPALRKATVRLNALALREWTAAYDDLMNNFPDDERWLRPTRLGNIASVQELYPLNRYGINLSALWPRLMHVITEDARLRIEEANIYLDFTVLMSLLSLSAAVIAGIAAFYGPSRSLALRIFLPLFFLLSSWLFYHLAIQATQAFGIQIQAAVDLFRLKLLDALEIERPETPAEEQAIWREMHYFIAQAELPKEHVRFKEAEKTPGEQKDKPVPSFWSCLRASLIRRRKPTATEKDIAQ